MKFKKKVSASINKPVVNRTISHGGERRQFWWGLVASRTLRVSYWLPFEKSCPEHLSRQRIKGSELYQQTNAGPGVEKPREVGILGVVTKEMNTYLLESSSE